MAKNKRAVRKQRPKELAKTNPRRVRYSVAMSLDGFIAGPNGEHDWIIMDPSFDFGALFAQFDTLLVAGEPSKRCIKPAGRRCRE